MPGHGKQASRHKRNRQIGNRCRFVSTIAAPLAVIQEPKWRVKTLLTKLDSVRRMKERGDQISDDLIGLSSKFTGQVSEIFSGLPKPKDPISFTTNDLPLLFTANEVQQFAPGPGQQRRPQRFIIQPVKSQPKSRFG